MKCALAEANGRMNSRKLLEVPEAFLRHKKSTCHSVRSNKLIHGNYFDMPSKVVIAPLLKADE